MDEIVKRLVWPVARRASVALTFAFIATLATMAHAQAASVTAALHERSAGSTTTAMRPLPEQLDEALTQVKEAQALRDKMASQRNGPYRQDEANDKQRLLDWLVDLQRDSGVAYILVTHDMVVARAFSHRIAVMYQGRIVEEGLTAEVLAAPRDPYTQKLLAAVQSL